jgi:nitrite reductase/ring-hydroxylating ferredoxin subunit
MPRVQVCTVAELQDHTMRRFILNGHEVLLAKIGGQYYAVNERCTHRGGPLSEGKLEGFNITCPLHFGEFNLQTGEATSPPASDPLRIYQVSVDAGQVYVDLPDSFEL